MTAYLVTHADRNGNARAERVEARTPKAAARKALAAIPNTSFGAERVSMAGAIRALEFSTRYGNGEVQWANQPEIALVRYAYREEMTPFWTDPEQWQDSEKHPLTVLD